MRLPVLAAAMTLALAACGGVMTVGFSRQPRTVHLRAGDEIGVSEDAGECGSPWSTRPAVIAAKSQPLAHDCSGGTVKFKAVSTGKAQIRGAVHCHVPDCAAAAAIIRVVVAAR